MLVWVFVKHKEGQNMSSTTGDIVYIYPMIDEILGKETLNYYFPVKMDLNIPCKFNVVDGKKQWACKDCQYNNSIDCDVIKYTSPEFDAGGIGVEPEIIKKRRYKINVDDVLLPSEKTLVEKKDKIKQEQDLVVATANGKLKLKTIIKDKKAAEK